LKTRLTPLLILAALALPVSLMAASPSQPETAPEAKPATTPQTVPSGIITTVAGDGFAGDLGNGGPATKAQLIYPTGVAVDSAGDLYIADHLSQVVRKVTASTGIISIYAGTGFAGYSGDNGKATEAELDEPIGLALDSTGNLYIADYRNNVVREVNAKSGIITTVAGNGYGAGVPGGVDNCGVLTLGVKATTTSLCNPQGLAVDGEGNLYIGIAYGYRVLKVTAATGILSAYAGNGNDGYSGDGGLAINAEMGYEAEGLALDSAGNLYIADPYYCAIRKVTASTGIITSLMGNGEPYNACNYNGNPGDGGPASKASVLNPYGIAVDASGDLFIADADHDSIRVIAAGNGNIYTLAGGYWTQTFGTSTYWFGQAGYSGDGGPAAAAYLNFPQGMALDSSGNLYIADMNNSVIRKVAQATVLPTETPVITPGSSSILKATTVTIASPVEGATIHYTTDGTTPTTSSPKYTEPFTVSKSETVEAVATLAGSPNTAAAVANYLYVAAPAVTTQAATGVTATGATLNGTVNAENGETGYWFAYGTSQSALTKATNEMGMPTGTTATAVSVALTGLTAGKTYYFQVVAQNQVGTTKGKVLSFTTK